MPRHHRKCDQRKGDAKLNDIQKKNTEPTSIQLTARKSNNDEPQNASSLEETLSQTSSAGDDKDEIDDDNDETHTTLLDANETGTPNFEEKSMN